MLMTVKNVRTFRGLRLFSSNILEAATVAEMQADKQWAASAEGRAFLTSSMLHLKGNQPNEHVLASTMRAYLQKRGIQLSLPTLDTEISSTTESVEKKDPSGVGGIEALNKELFQAVDNRDFNRVQELEKEIEVLEKEGGESLILSPSSSSAVNMKRVEKHEPLVDYVQNQGTSESRTLTSLCSFPLSLAFGIRKIYGAPITNLSVLVIGARSESSLPSVWWLETLIACEKIHSLSIHMIGPHLDQKKMNLGKLKEIVQWKQGGGCETGREIDVNLVPSGRVALHDHQECLRLLRGHDIFVLFNPGFGSTKVEGLVESWRPTISYLLQTRKPILCTALSKYDMERDLNMLEQITNEEDDQHLGTLVEILKYAHIYIYIYIYMLIYTYICSYIHAYIHIIKHTH